MNATEQTVNNQFSFEVTASVDSGVGMARAGVLQTPHGTIETPVFMPVGTQASVKAVSQEQLGADIIMVLDECTPYPSSHDYNRRALARTHAWAERCLQAQTRKDQALFGIVQGSTYHDLREESARVLTSLDFPGYAIGGLS